VRLCQADEERVGSGGISLQELIHPPVHQGHGERDLTPTTKISSLVLFVDKMRRSVRMLVMREKISSAMLFGLRLPTSSKAAAQQGS